VSDSTGDPLLDATKGELVEVYLYALGDDGWAHPVMMQRPHWYMITTYYCPVCGNESTYRERRYDPRPEAYEDRHKFIQSFDWCSW
jgi:hypothetical protein